MRGIAAKKKTTANGRAKPILTTGGKAVLPIPDDLYAKPNLAGCKGLRRRSDSLFENEASDCAFTDAAKVKRALVLDCVGNLGIAVRRAILEILGNASIGIESEHK